MTFEELQPLLAAIRRQMRAPDVQARVHRAFQPALQTILELERQGARQQVAALLEHIAARIRAARLPQ